MISWRYMKTFIVRIDEEDMKLLDKRRGKLGRGQYLTELMRRNELISIPTSAFGENMVPASSLVEPGKKSGKGRIPGGEVEVALKEKKADNIKWEAIEHPRKDLKDLNPLSDAISSRGWCKVHRSMQVFENGECRACRISRNN